MPSENLFPEITAIAILIAGFIVAALGVRSPLICFILIFLFGLMFGRMWVKVKNAHKLRYVFIVVGFFIGYVAANVLMGYTNVLMMLILFVAGIWLSYMIHVRNLLSSIEY